MLLIFPSLCSSYGRQFQVMDWLVRSLLKCWIIPNHPNIKQVKLVDLNSTCLTPDLLIQKWCYVNSYFPKTTRLTRYLIIIMANMICLTYIWRLKIAFRKELHHMPLLYELIIIFKKLYFSKGHFHVDPKLTRILDLQP